MENRKKTRYLLIYCGGSGYPDQITDFFKNTYPEKEVCGGIIYEREYYDVVAELGSIYSLLIIRDKAPKGLSYFLDTLVFKINFYIEKHNLDSVVVIGEPDCVWYKELLEIKEGIIPEFETQKDAFITAIKTLRTVIPSNYIKFISGWYIIDEDYINKISDKKTMHFEKIYHFDDESKIEII